METFVIPIDTYRTHNRNRSLSFINSDQLVNVNKGSRQIKPVTLGKRLALMIEHQVKIRRLEYRSCRSVTLTSESLLRERLLITYSENFKRYGILSPFAISD